MPVIFSERVYRAVAKNRPAVLRRLKPAHFETYRALNEALSWLSPQERCDAVYGDWLESIDSQAGATLLRTRILLIEQGGLAANYLAEFAQNADDAYPRDSGGEVHISAPQGWLQVWNNGRAINGTDLLGLCRFFSNGSKIEATTSELIGKFGIGFKSCYRIGTEVWVGTWEGDTEFCFRIPLSRGDWPQSHYDAETFERVRLALREIISSQPRTSQDELGFCTPEFAAVVPDDLKSQFEAAKKQAPEHGTFFAVRLHAEGEKVLRSRLRDQSEQVFELCPLFVRRLRLTRLEETSLRLVVHRENGDENIAGVVDAERVTLEAKRDGSSKSNSRFWRLTEAKPENAEGWKPWRIALHADSRFQLNLSRDEEETTSLRDGAAYAFFPLAINWPFNLHLHLDLPTNLDRSSWNPKEQDAISKALAKAASGLGQWLSQNRRLWHPGWSVSALLNVDQVQSSRGQTTSPDQLFYAYLKSEVQNRPLLRSIWGGFIPGKNARWVSMRGLRGQDAAWKAVGSQLDEASESYPWCTEEEGLKWGVPELDVKAFVAAAREWKVKDDSMEEFGRHLLTLVLSVSCLGKKEWDILFPLIPVQRELTLLDLLKKPGGASLSENWHNLFAQLAHDLDDMDWAAVHFEGRSLVSHFLRLKKPRWNPDWAVLPKILHPGLPLARVDEVWESDKEPCPVDLQDRVLDALVARNSGDVLCPLRSIWVFSRNVPDAFKDLFASASFPRSVPYRDRLQQWGLLERYREGVESKLKSELGARIAAALKAAMQGGTLALWLDGVQKSSRELEAVDLLWQKIYEQLVRSSLADAFTNALSAVKDETVISRSIDPDLRSVLAWLSTYRNDVLWLDDSVWAKLRDLRMGDLLSDYQILRRSDVATKRGELVRALLKMAHHWPSKSPTQAQLSAIDRLAAELSKAERREMAVGISARTTKRLDEFLSSASEEEDPNCHWLRLVPGYADKLIPPLLAQVRSLREVCPCTDDLTVKVEGLPEMPLCYPTSSLSEEIAQLPAVQRLLDAGQVSEICEHRPIELQWWEGDRLVTEFSKAKFFFQRDTRRLFVTQLKVSLGDYQLESVLHTYLTFSNKDPEVDAAFQEAKQQRIPLLQVYTRFREKIIKILLGALVTKNGYNTSHIWRELLQNAENAYASMPDPRPLTCVFEIEAKEDEEKRWQVKVTNYGRRFNQPDRENQQRRDLDRIISLDGERHQVSGELGRYNLGFKSLFSTTDVVSVTSGGYDFQVRDLLLRYPANPTEDLSQAERPTSFTWSCSRADLDKILGLGGKPTKGGISPFLTPAYLLFGRYVSHVVLKLKETRAELEIERRLDAGKELVTVTSSGSSSDSFLVLRGDCMLGQPPSRYSFAAAVKLDRRGFPTPTKDEEQYFHLTYPTKERSFVPFIIHGDFELAGVNRDQFEKQSRRNLSLILSTTRLVFGHAVHDLEQRLTAERWLGWVKVLAPSALVDGVRSNYEEGTGEAVRLADEVKERLLELIPHGGSCRSIRSLDVPSTLMRKFAAKYGDTFGIKTEDWLDEVLTQGVKELGRSETLKLNEWVSVQPQDESSLALIDEALQDFKDFTNQELFELSAARKAASSRIQVIPKRETSWNLERIASWWKDEGGAGSVPYTLEGDLFPWVHREAGNDPIETSAARRHYLFKYLSSPDTEQGQETWYRLFTFACLLSAGHRVEGIHRFLQELNAHGFFTKTVGANVEFADATAEIFDALVHRPHTNEIASGEDAHFWRHIFYDARKVHHLVYRNGFAEVFLELCRDENCGEVLPRFLRSGQLPGQRPWQGVLGQSAAAPLLFVIRELRRLGVIRHTKADSFAFFACKPVRKVAAALGWVDEGYEDYVSFDELLEVSQTIHAKYLENESARKILLPHFDIPLLALERAGILYHA